MVGRPTTLQRIKAMVPGTKENRVKKGRVTKTTGTSAAAHPGSAMKSKVQLKAHSCGAPPDPQALTGMHVSQIPGTAEHK